MVIRNTLIVFVFAFLYSVLRYTVFDTIPFEDIPTMIVNKAVSFSMIILLMNATLSYVYKKQDEYYGYLNIVKMFAIIHVLLSVTLL